MKYGVISRRSLFRCMDFLAAKMMRNLERTKMGPAGSVGQKVRASSSIAVHNAESATLHRRGRGKVVGFALWGCEALRAAAAPELSSRL